MNGYNAALSALESAYTDTVTVKGNVTLSNGGMLSLSNNDGGLTSLLIEGNFTVADSAYIGKNNSANLSKFVFNGNAAQNVAFPASGATNFFGAPNFEVESGATFAVDSSVIGGTGSFVVKPYGVLRTTHAGGINGNILCTGTNGGGNRFLAGSGYIFSGTGAQAGGSYLPDTVGWLVLNNSVSVTLSKGIVINDTLELVKGSLIMGANTVRYKPNATLKYSGSGAATTSDAEFPASNGPTNIISSKTGGLTLHAPRIISGNLDLHAGKFTLGANTFIASSVSNATTSKFVVTNDVGMLKIGSVGTSEKQFPVGTGSTYAPVWISNSGVVDSIGVNVSGETHASPYGGKVKVIWNLAESNPGGGNYTLQFGWASALEDNAFRTNRAGNAKIFHFPDSLEVGTGDYTYQFAAQPYTVSRAGITTLGSFAVGKFANVTGVDELRDVLPTVFKLGQNYPNPFNPVTVISYQLPVQSHVSLKVYDVLGREVETLLNEVKDAGYYSFDFNAGKISSGIYFYRVETNTGFVQTKKMIVLK